MAREREIQDHYFREAKREGYCSRAAYKLIEIDDRRKLIAKGDAVLDCGCAPGSWLQVAAARVGRKGVVVGIDLKPVRLDRPHPNVHILEGDLTAVDVATLVEPIRNGGKARFDVVLSDMAPNTTGDKLVDHHGSIRLCETLLDRCPDLLHRGGTLVMKVFEGENYPALLASCKEVFDAVKGYKPKASRSMSTEMYLIATGHRPATEPSPGRRTAPKKRPTGWG